MSKNIRKCAICDKPQDEKYKPFCSDRCSKLDLGKWLGESYVVKTPEDPAYEDSTLVEE